MIERIVNNFYLRNLFALLVYISPTLLQNIANYQVVGTAYIVKYACGHIAFFMFFVFHSRVLYEKIFLKRKFILYVILFFLTMFIWRESTSYLIWLVTRQPGETIYYIEELKNSNWVYWLFIYWADFVYSWIALGVYLAFRYFRELTRLLQVENVKKELELKQLNEQLNPHFLFNALNNIYSHILRGSVASKELILKLSELMRYILNSSKHDTVSLHSEISFIEHYIAFEKERLGERCELHYTKNISSSGFNIVPLILFTYIENAFKYGTASIHKSDIYIDIRADEQSLKLRVSNAVFVYENNSPKTGLDNASRRLAILYPDAHTLHTIQDEGSYTVMLEIQNKNEA